MYIRSLQLEDYRSWRTLDLALTPGVTIFSGPNGHGKTNIVEALGYLAHLGSHRVSTDSALVREGQKVASISATAVNEGRELTTHLAVRASGANRARINRTAMRSPRDILGIVRTTLFSPEDLALIRGEPEQRRNFLDSIMLARYPRLAGVKADYDRALRQRNALLRNSSFVLRHFANGVAAGPGNTSSSTGISNFSSPSDTAPGEAQSGVGAAVGMARAGSSSHISDAESALATLDVWDGQLAALGGQLMSARVQIVHDLAPHVAKTYQRLAPESRPAHMAYTSTIDSALHEVGVQLGHSKPGEPTALLSPDVAEAVLLQAFAEKRPAEIDRGTTLLGPHRDDVVFTLGTQPAKGFASHGESWSFALALRLGAYFMGRADGAEPIVILDDVFAELDKNRRRKLVDLLQDAEQVLITAAVGEDIPVELRAQATIFDILASVDEEGQRISQISAVDTDEPQAKHQKTEELGPQSVVDDAGTAQDEIEEHE
ncbi:DNA replication/repair protein RecF [Corynebacterium auriscanis]|uniref:DNA replication/repair protein RecF n=1 Tax=Corynebacterium auriscanis TaxID=99807 RepID=UPI003CF3021F